MAETLLEIFVPWGVLALTSGGRVLYANAHAQRVLQQGDGLRLLDGVLRTARREDSRGIAELLRQARLVVEPSEFEVIGCRRISRSFGQRDLTLICARLGGADTKVGDGSVTVLLIAEPEEEGTGSSLRRLLGAGGPRGLTIRQIGAELAVTFRSQSTP